MRNKLITLLKKSYCPYSRVQVAAIVVDSNGNEYKGFNIENASFSPSICAERNAIFNFIIQTNNYQDIQELHLISSIKGLLFPCGVCRQVMSEFFHPNVKIFIYNLQNNECFETSFVKLMPFPVKGNFFNND